MNVKQLQENLEHRWDSLSPAGRQKFIDIIDKEKGKKKTRSGIPLAQKKTTVKKVAAKKQPAVKKKTRRT